MLDKAKQRGFMPEAVLFDSWFLSMVNLMRVRAHGGGFDNDLKTLGLSAMPYIAGLKSAYCTFAMKQHQDRGDDEAALITVNAAHERLLNRVGL